jgi:hypothetical protein
VLKLDLLYGNFQVFLVLNSVVLSFVIILFRETVLPNFILLYI